MKTLYLECNMGAAGDMLSAALLELHPEPEKMLQKLNMLGIPGIVYSSEAMEKCGIRGTHLKVTVNGEEEESLDVHGHHHHHDHDEDHDHGHHHHHDHDEDHDHAHHHYHGHDEDHDHGHHHHDHDEDHDHAHHHHHGHDEDHDHGSHHDHDHEHGHHHHHVHRNLGDIEAIVSNLVIPETVRENIMKVYKVIAQAESHAHNRPVEEVHFHEVGSMDAVADITAFCLILSELAPDRILASPVRIGFGEVRCAHGILPVPAPAAAWILQDIPVYAGDIRGELCTPTGAALLKCFADDFCTLPQMKVQKIGLGCGKKDFPQANCVRALLGETPDSRETILELTCNLDDMTPEALGFAMEEILAAGAVDVFTIPVTMKKSRPGFLLTCMCRESLRDEILRNIFLHTTTLGVRENVCNRYTLRREIEARDTADGEIRRKTASGWGTRRDKYEFEDLARIAREKGISLAEAAETADQYFK